MEVESFEETDFIIDNYSHPDFKIFYTVTKIPGKGISESKFEDFYLGCKCSDFQCTDQKKCSCLKYGKNYNLKNDSLLLEENKFGNLPVVECNFRCSCFKSLKDRISTSPKRVKSCQNRNVQFGPINCLEIFDAGVKGLGLKTNRRILAGTYICEYAGEVIGLEEAKLRQKQLMLNGEMNYIFILKEYAGDNPCDVTCVDPGVVGNIGRYINHSCQPNSVIVPVRVNNAVPWLCIFALRDIKENEEICFDYSGHNLGVLDGNNFENRKPCYCGTVSCKKFLPYELNV